MPPRSLYCYLLILVSGRATHALKGTDWWLHGRRCFYCYGASNFAFFGLMFDGVVLYSGWHDFDDVLGEEGVDKKNTNALPLFR